MRGGDCLTSSFEIPLRPGWGPAEGVVGEQCPADVLEELVVAQDGIPAPQEGKGTAGGEEESRYQKGIRRY